MSFTSIKRKITNKNTLVSSMYEPEKLQGTKWNHVNTGRTGFNTILDRDIIARHIRTEKQNLGQGFLRLNVPGYDATNPSPINIGGRLMYPDGNGDVVIIDNAVVKKMKEREEEKRKYLEELIETCSLSDEICALVLGLDSKEDLKGILGDNGKAGDNDLSTDLIAVDARPSAIETYDPTSQTYSKAIQKFKICLQKYMPVLDNLTPEKTMNQEA